MARLPLIVSFGGYNTAGRSSFHHGYRRLVLDAIDANSRQETLANLGVMTKTISSKGGQFYSPDGSSLDLNQIEASYKQEILDSTLVRKIEKYFFDVDQANELRDYPVKAAGQLPSNFAPSEHYASRFHPRGLQMAILGASDAINAMGIDWNEVRNEVQPDEIAVYASSAMGQLDDCGTGGLIKARLEGKRVSAKQLALGLNSMPADFINAYVLGNVGSTSSLTGACASFLYNLKNGVEAIQNGKSRVVLVGCSEAPITPEVMDGYSTMGALGTDEALKRIEDKFDPNGTDAELEQKAEPKAEPDHRRASRPFGENCGFTIAESSQFVVLMDDELALTLGAQVHGAVSDVFVNADGYKKSIPAPGPGNYITLAKAVASASQLLGMDAVRQQSIVMAHGSSTPQNRVTESELFDKVAEAFGITSWPISAVKAYLGHPLAAASGDQLTCALGVFKYQILPGIKTIDDIAEDVVRSRLAISKEDLNLKHKPPKVAFLNSKGFGGNNASAVVLSGDVAKDMLAKRYGTEALAAWQEKQEKTLKQAKDYDQAALHGQLRVIYKFGENMIDESALKISDQGIDIPGFEQSLRFKPEQRYADMC